MLFQQSWSTQYNFHKYIAAQTQIQKHNGKVWQLFWGTYEYVRQPDITLHFDVTYCAVCIFKFIDSEAISNENRV